jgi:signal peptidase I
LDAARIDSLAMSTHLKPGTLVFIRPFTFLSSPIESGDIIEMAFPFTDKDSLEKGLFFKRIAGLPGDTVSIRASVVFRNNRAMEINTDLLHNYILKFKQQKDTGLFADEKIAEKYLVDDSCVYLVTLTDARYMELKNKGVSIQENREDSGLYDENVFPNDPKIKWNTDFFGPLYIPKKNDTIRLDTAHLALYKQLIVDLEKNSLEVKDGKIILNEKEATYYVVKEDYYFVIGDNFDNAVDSRYWGFVPKRAVKAKLIQ